MKQVEILTLDEALLQKGRGKDLRPRKRRSEFSDQFEEARRRLPKIPEKKRKKSEFSDSFVEK